MIDINTILKEINSEIFLRDFLHKSIVNTLVKNFSNLYEIYILSEEEFLQLKGAGKTKVQYLNEVKFWIDNHHQLLADYYEYVVKFKVIPSKPAHDKSILENLYEALKELRHIIDVKTNLPYVGDAAQLKIYRNQLPSENGWIRHTEINEHIVDLIDWYYGLEGNRILTKNEIGVKKGFDAYNVNHIIIKPLKPLFLEGEIRYGVQLNKDLREAALEELEKSFYRSSETSGLFESDFFDIDLFRNVLELFDADLIKGNAEDEQSEYMIVPSGKASVYRLHTNYLNALLLYGQSYSLSDLMDVATRNNDSYLASKSSFKSMIKNGGPSASILDKILNDSIQIEKTKNESNEWVYQYKWQFLHGDNNRIDRLLLEEGGVRSEDEIIELFNERASNFDNIALKTQDKIFLSTSKNIVPIGKTKNWIHKNHLDKNLEKSLSGSLQNHIDELLSAKFNGKASFEEIKNALSKEIIQSYPELSIKVYLQNIAFQSKEDDNTFIHKSFIKIYPNIKLKKKRNNFFGNELFLFTAELLKSKPDYRIVESEYFEIILKRYPELLKSNLYNYLDKFSEKRLILIENKDETPYIQLEVDELDNYDLNRLFKAEEPAYRIKIRAKIIEALKTASNQRIQLNVLTKRYLKFLPEGYANTNFYKILNDSTLFTKVEDSEGTVWVELVKENLPAARTSHEEVIDEPAKKDEELNLVVRQELDLQRLKVSCFSEILDQERRYGLDEQFLETAFEIFVNTLQNNDGVSYKRYGNRLLQSVYQFLIGKTDIYDREICFSILTSSFQTYLSNLLDADDHYPGQTALFLSNEKMKILWEYKFNKLASNTTWLNFSKILHSLKYFSDIDRHQKDHEDLSMGALKLTKNIVDFIALYLFTAEIVKNSEARGH